MSTPTTGSSTEPTPRSHSKDRPERSPGGQSALLRQVASSPAVVGLLAILTALFLSSILILAADAEVRYTAGYLLNRPGDFLHAAGSTLSEAYSSLLRGSVLDWRATTGVRMIRPITDTLTNATPLIIAGLGMAVAFRAGLFNIGGQGQMILGAITACYVGIAWNLPPVVHLILAVVGAALGGLLWGGIAGVLKARTGANEVIVTIMLNSIAAHLLSQVLSLKAFNGEGETGNRKSLTVADSAQYPSLAGSSFRLRRARFSSLRRRGLPAPRFACRQFRRSFSGRRHERLKGILLRVPLRKGRNERFSRDSSGRGGCRRIRLALGRSDRRFRARCPVASCRTL